MIKITDLSKVHQILLGEIENFCGVIFALYQNVYRNSVLWLFDELVYIFKPFFPILLADEFYRDVLVASIWESVSSA